jgi:hypothetical protein
MLGKSTVLEVGENYITKHDVTSRYLGLKLNSTNYNTDIFRSINMELFARKASIILTGEQLYTKLMTLPKAKKEVMQDLIKSELYYHFKDMNDIAFNYTIFKENKTNYELLVFCINCRNFYRMQKHFSNKMTITGIYLIQFCCLNYFKIKINEKNFIFALRYLDNLYLLYCVDYNIIYCETIKEIVSDYNLTNVLHSFIDQGKATYNVEVNKIYFANFADEDIKNSISHISHFENLGQLDNKSLIKGLKAKRRKVL